MSTLATLASLKSRLGFETFDTDNDAQLANFLALVTGRFELECNRTFELSAGYDHEFSAERLTLLPERFPITAVTAWALKSDETEGWVVQTDVTCRIGAKKNLIHLDSPLGTEDQIARATLTGGYVLPGGTVGSGQTALPSEIEQAALEQAVWFWQNRDRLGLASVSGDGGSIAGNPVTVELLPFVSAILKKYVRWNP